MPIVPLQRKHPIAYSAAALQSHSPCITDSLNSTPFLCTPHRILLEQLGPEPVEILALDLAGHGTSDHRTSEDYALWRYIEDADQIVEQLGWQRHAIIGHSMGGAISTLYAGLFESR